MLDLEAQMRVALEGQFFYEHTHRVNGPSCEVPESEMRRVRHNAGAASVARHYVKGGPRIRTCDEAHRKILNAVAKAHGLDADQMLVVEKDRDYTLARGHMFHVVMDIYCTGAFATGRAYGYDHKSVRNCVKRFKEVIDQYTDHIAMVKEELK